jgi:hypothetical protein
MNYRRATRCREKVALTHDVRGLLNTILHEGAHRFDMPPGVLERMRRQDVAELRGLREELRAALGSED